MPVEESRAINAIKHSTTWEENVDEFIPTLENFNSNDFFALLGYFLLNLIIVTHLLYRQFHNKKYNRSFILPLVLLSIPAAIAIHTVTAFLFNALPARPFWNSALLAPRFLATAFCSGPALLILIFQVLRKTTKFKIKDEAIFSIAELIPNVPQPNIPTKDQMSRPNIQQPNIPPINLNTN